MIRVRNGHGQFADNISDKDFLAGVKRELGLIDTHRWQCWQCGTVYDCEPQPGHYKDCPDCEAPPVPF